jgi:hypothetical protein
VRILYIGELTPFTRCEQRLRTLRELGHEVRALSYLPVLDGPQDAQRLPIVPRVLNRVGVPLDLERVNERTLDAAARERFDLLWVEKARMLHAPTLVGFRRLQPDAALAYFSEDDMVLRQNASLWFRAALPLYDTVFTTKLRNLADGELAALGARRVLFEPKTFDPRLHRPVPVDDAVRARLGSDVLFVGTFERERARSCLALARAGVRVRVFGHGWERFRSRHDNLLVERRAIGGEDYVAALCAAKIALGFLRKKSRDEHTDRSVEIPACGAFMLAERSREHSRLFREHREAVFFESDEELIAETRRYLADDVGRTRIALAGRRRCVDDGYDHAAALRRMLAAATGAPHRSETDSTTAREEAA